MGTTVDGYTWNYVGSNGSSNTAPKTLAQVAALAPVSPATATRDPDFFEMIQAAVLRGSLAVYVPRSGSVFFDARGPDDLAITIMQIGADVIDQYKADGVPTSINFSGPVSNSSGAEPDFVSGMENLPYFSEVLLWPYRPLSDPVRFTLNVYLLMELWNPHQNASSIAAAGGGFVPSKLRLCVDDRGGVVTTHGSKTTPMAQVLQGKSNAYSPAGTIRVEYNNSTRFAEPTVLDSTLVNPESTQR